MRKATRDLENPVAAKMVPRWTSTSDPQVDKAPTLAGPTHANPRAPRHRHAVVAGITDGKANVERQAGADCMVDVAAVSVPAGV